jgi:hypothetical protein
MDILLKQLFLPILFFHPWTRWDLTDGGPNVDTSRGGVVGACSLTFESGVDTTTRLMQGIRVFDLRVWGIKVSPRKLY